MDPISAYRAFYRCLLWFGPQQRVPLKAYLRQRFSADAEEPHAVAKTLTFIRAAAKSEGLERRIVVGLAEHTASVHKVVSRVQPKKYRRDLFDRDVEMYKHIKAELNRTHGMCL